MTVNRSPEISVMTTHQDSEMDRDWKWNCFKKKGDSLLTCLIQDLSVRICQFLSSVLSQVSLVRLCLVPRRLSLDENVRAKEGGRETVGTCFTFSSPEPLGLICNRPTTWPRNDGLGTRMPEGACRLYPSHGPLRFITSHSFRACLCHAKKEAPEEEAEWGSFSVAPKPVISFGHVVLKIRWLALKKKQPISRSLYLPH